MVKIQLSTNPPNTYIKGYRLVPSENAIGSFDLEGEPKGGEKDVYYPTIMTIEITEIVEILGE